MARTLRCPSSRSAGCQRAVRKSFGWRFARAARPHQPGGASIGHASTAGAGEQASKQDVGKNAFRHLRVTAAPGAAPRPVLGRHGLRSVR